MRPCSACAEQKPLTEFGKDRQVKDGLRRRCFVCERARTNAFKDAHRSDVRSKGRVYALAKREENAARAAAWAKKNPERVRELQRDWVLRNPEKTKQYRRRWAQTHAAVCVEYVAARRATKRLASPAWADRDAIRAAYTAARERTALTGVTHHVDHIVPLKSPQVCGLHTEANLQVLPAAVNAAKKNTYWPDMPAGEML